MHSGLAPRAAPTAREAVGRSIARASPPYVSRSPYPTVRANVASTSRWNGVARTRSVTRSNSMATSGKEVVELPARVVQGAGPA